MERKTPETKKPLAHKAKDHPTTSNNEKTSKKAGKEVDKDSKKKALQPKRVTKKNIENIKKAQKSSFPAAYLFLSRSKQNSKENKSVITSLLSTTTASSVVKSIQQKKAEYFKTKKRKPIPIGTKTGRITSYMQHNCSKAIKQEAINMTNTYKSLAGEKAKPNLENQGNLNQVDPGKRQKTSDEMDIELDPLHDETLEITMEDVSDKPSNQNKKKCPTRTK